MSVDYSDIKKLWSNKSLDILHDHIESMACAFLSRTNIPPERAVLVQKNLGNEIRYWFEERKDEIGTPKES